MRDFATSDDPLVQIQLDRLAGLSLPQGRIGIEAIRVLLARLENPQDNLPPVFHVAGTNGKGSTCAFLRAILEAEGLRVHATTSPHLVRYNERIRIAGELIEDAALAALLAEVLDTAQGLAISFFEVTIAAAFLAFSRHAADACVIEVGLGGRFDATNVIARPVVCGIATLGIDHEQFLLSPEDGTPKDPLARIAFEKAGIAKAGVPLVTQAYPPAATHEIIAAARRNGASLRMRGQAWSGSADDLNFTYRDETVDLEFPCPPMAGAHQVDNALLAIAMLRSQDTIKVDVPAIGQGLRNVRWPARLQRLGPGSLTALAPGRDIWLDGGHNRDAGAAIARHFSGKRLHLIIGMLASKEPSAITAPLAATTVSTTAVPIPGHEHHDAGSFGPDAIAAPDVIAALSHLPDDGLPVLICGSLYLAGEVLRLNDELPG